MNKREQTRDAMRRFRQTHPDYHKEWVANNRDKVNIYQRNNRRALKLATLIHYSGGTPHCKCCGEKHIEFLCIDHINGCGYQHRKEIKRKGGNEFYSWLKRNNYPFGFRVLCFNCNCALAFYGYCPHQIQEAKIVG